MHGGDCLVRPPPGAGELVYKNIERYGSERQSLLSSLPESQLLPQATTTSFSCNLADIFIPFPNIHYIHTNTGARTVHPIQMLI